jgi:hypothetical protein
MNLEITTPDPFHILSSTKTVMEKAKYVSLNMAAVKEQAPKIAKYLKDNNDFPDHGHRLTGNFETDTQLIFFESMMGFCFWSLPGQDKWAIKMPDGEILDGWYGVCAAFKRAYDEGIPVTDVEFLMKADKNQIEKIFHSINSAQIPLLEQRVKILNENAKILKKQFGGRASNFINTERDAVKLFELLVKYFPSYRDVAKYNGKEVIFLKIAHLLALDLQYRLNNSQQPFLSNFDKLCVFADYKLPQLLRMYGVLEYSNQLAAIVDEYKEIPAGSPEEVEIRSGCIWGVELLRQQSPNYSSTQVGHVIWLASQDQALQSKIKPYHRTLTTYY